MCLEDYNQELKQIRSDHAKRICAMELERTNNEKQYETNLEKIKDEVYVHDLSGRYTK
ncbi:unnamed protein product [Schistosoma mattheei]|uniref:Uncharacterized protein n=1 Tax=Schistosoma mattheei TaxID=31246 RepID=A0A183NNV6_9TREM|nr:unnamed protein product [Schistosoma mattheei]